MTLQLIILVLAVLANTILGISGVYRKPKSTQTWIFFVLALALNGWLTANYFSLQESDVMTLHTILTWLFAFVVLQNTAYAFFILRQTDTRLPPSSVLAYGSFSLLLIVAALAGFVFADNMQDGVFNITPSWGMPFFVLHAGLSIGFGFVRIITILPKTKGAQHNQLNFLLLSSLILFTLVPLANFVLPVVFSNQTLLVFAPIFSIASSALIAYAMFRHHLFDIRTLVIRAVVYLGLTTGLGWLYVWAVFNAGTTFLETNGLQAYLQIFYIITTILVGVSFHTLRLFFDRVTNRIFFQDAYETNVVLDKITSVLVRNVAVDRLSKQSMTILTEAIKSEQATVVVGEFVEGGKKRIITVGKQKYNFEALSEVLNLHPHPLLLLDDITDRTSRIYKLMNKTNVAVIARLETSKELIGYLLFGYKASGNIYSKQDIELIKIASDELAVAIQNALRFEEIERFNERLQGEVEEATAELRANNKKLKALDEAKDEFISMASHQLRTPLTSVKGYVSMVLDGDAGELTKDQRKLLQEAYASSQRMVYMIADFLNVSRLKTGKFLLEPSSVSLPELINEEVSQLQPTATARGITIETHLAEHFPAMQLDETKIRQVIMNFIDNAIFYSNSGGDIVITLELGEKYISFTVKDNGIGVPPSEQAKVFSKFFRATNARHVRPDGTGIGLFMAKKVVSAHGGDMIFETKENKGSIFGFTLPLTSEK